MPTPPLLTPEEREYETLQRIATAMSENVRINADVLANVREYQKQVDENRQRNSNHARTILVIQTILFLLMIAHTVVFTLVNTR